MNIRCNDVMYNQKSEKYVKSMSKRMKVQNTDQQFEIPLIQCLFCSLFKAITDYVFYQIK